MKRIMATRQAAYHGWSMGFDKYKCTTSAVTWERRYAWRGLIAGLIVAALIGAYCLAIAAVGAPWALMAVCVIAFVCGGGIKFYEWLDRDNEDRLSDGVAGSRP